MPDPTPAAVAPNLRPPAVAPDRPRVHLGAAELARLRRDIPRDPDLAACVDRIRQRARKLLDQPLKGHDIPDGKRLLSVSRDIVEQAYFLGLTWLIDADAKIKNRLWAQLEAAAAFPDWNPSHFLDTAEMAHAFAVAYDWLYNDWTDAQRCTLREAIVRHAFTPAMAAYQKGGFWSEARNNWNIVCHGGLTAAAVALGDETPAQTQRVLTQALANAHFCLDEFAPDGGWPEGPGYWDYTLRYLVPMLASLRAVSGGEHGLGDLPGLDRTALFRIQLSGPSGRDFNYSDAHDGRSFAGTGAMAGVRMWLAQRYRLPAAVHALPLQKQDHPYAAIWWHRPPADAPILPPLDAVFRGVEVCTLRQTWGPLDADRAWWIAAQCGQNTTGHNQADLGSFVLEALGVRWVIDPGPDDYNLPEFFGKRRYEYYRNRTEGHNTLLVNPDRGAGQDVKVGGRILRSQIGPEIASPWCEMDLTPAYAHDGAASVLRRFDFPGRSSLLVADEVRLQRPGDIWWFAHTRSAIALADDGRSAVLSDGDHRLRVRLDRLESDAADPAAARLISMPARPLPTSPDPAGQNPNNGAKLLNASRGHGQVKVGDTPRWGPPDEARAIRKLAIHIAGVTRLRLRVAFEAVSDPQPG